MKFLVFTMVASAVTSTSFAGQLRCQATGVDTYTKATIESTKLQAVEASNKLNGNIQYFSFEVSEESSAAGVLSMKIMNNDRDVDSTLSVSKSALADGVTLTKMDNDRSINLTCIR